ncbi:MAG: hypothetical protein CBC13_00240 [Planctomycetia bacterium TMED53]|nr:MAG: hypothetical protein CBC13_00240 [Planctomycetia bacterium TMED53]
MTSIIGANCLFLSFWQVITTFTGEIIFQKNRSDPVCFPDSSFESPRALRKLIRFGGLNQFAGTWFIAAYSVNRMGYWPEVASARGENLHLSDSISTI